MHRLYVLGMFYRATRSSGLLYYLLCHSAPQTAVLSLILLSLLVECRAIAPLISYAGDSVSCTFVRSLLVLDLTRSESNSKILQVSSYLAKMLWSLMGELRWRLCSDRLTPLEFDVQSNQSMSPYILVVYFGDAIGPQWINFPRLFTSATVGISSLFFTMALTL